MQKTYQNMNQFTFQIVSGDKVSKMKSNIDFNKISRIQKLLNCKKENIKAKYKLQK